MKWTEKHRNVARKLVLVGGWVQKKLHDVDWSDESECQACHKESRMARSQRGRFQRPSESASKKPTLLRNSGSGKEVLSRTLSVKANGTGVISV